MLNIATQSGGGGSAAVWCLANTRDLPAFAMSNLARSAFYPLVVYLYLRRTSVGVRSLHRDLVLTRAVHKSRRVRRILPPPEVLLVCFEVGIHLEQAAEPRNCNIILSLCHGFRRRNQSSTDRSGSDALTVARPEDKSARALGGSYCFRRRQRIRLRAAKPTPR